MAGSRQRPLRLGVVATFLPVSALADNSVCPETVSPKQVGVTPAPEWSVSYSTLPNELDQVTFYNGPLQVGASLAYDDWVNAKRSSRATWKLPKDPRGYWVKCSYRGTVSPARLPAIKSIACP